MTQLFEKYNVSAQYEYKSYEYKLILVWTDIQEK